MTLTVYQAFISYLSVFRSALSFLGLQGCLLTLYGIVCYIIIAYHFSLPDCINNRLPHTALLFLTYYYGGSCNIFAVYTRGCVVSFRYLISRTSVCVILFCPCD